MSKSIKIITPCSSGLVDVRPTDKPGVFVAETGAMFRTKVPRNSNEHQLSLFVFESGGFCAKVWAS